MKKVLVLGASINANRYSNIAIKKLRLKNYDVVGIGLRTGEVEGVSILTNPNSISDVHTVTVYLNPVNQKSYYDYILELKPKRVIFNPGSENREFEAILDKIGIQYEKACTLVLLSLNEF